MDTESIVYASLTHIIPEHCQNWISDSKIYSTDQLKLDTRMRVSC